MTRRVNGAGTIVQRTDGRFHAAYYVLAPDGTRRRRFVYGKTWDECNIKLVEMKNQTERGVPLAVPTWTIERYASHWLATIAGPGLRATTRTGYESVIRLHITPRLGKKRLDRLTPQDIRQWLAALRREGLAVRTVQYAHAVLRNMLQAAVRDEVLARNVAKLVQVESPHYEVGQGLTVAQAKTLLDAVAGTRWHAIYGLALTLGLRRGELLGLRWADIDLQAGQLTVRQNLVRAAGELRIQAPKTRKSVRTLPLPSYTKDLLATHRDRQAEDRNRAGETWADNGLVFTTSVGTPIEPRNLTRNFESVRERIGLPTVRLHDLRHTCITLLLGMGTPPHIVQAIAGHSHIDVTMSIYAHTRLDDQTKALSTLAAALGGGR